MTLDPDGGTASERATVSPPEERGTGELGRAIDALTREFQEMRKEVSATLTALRSEFVPKVQFDGEVRLLNMRQDTYQKQTDTMLQGVEEEMHLVRRKLDGMRDELDEHEKQRREDRRRILASWVAPIVTAVLAGVILWALLGHPS